MTITKPALVLDERRARRNIARMAAGRIYGRVCRRRGSGSPGRSADPDDPWIRPDLTLMRRYRHVA